VVVIVVGRVIVIGSGYEDLGAKVAAMAGAAGDGRS
jgi:hypothetical protein